MSEFDQVEWEASYEFPPGPKPMLLEAESPEAGKFGPLHVFAVVPLDAAEKACEAGVQAERERIEAGIEERRNVPTDLTDHDRGYRSGLSDALAVVTKEGETSE